MGRVGIPPSLRIRPRAACSRRRPPTAVRRQPTWESGETHHNRAHRGRSHAGRCGTATAGGARDVAAWPLPTPDCFLLCVCVLCLCVVKGGGFVLLITKSPGRQAPHRIPETRYRRQKNTTRASAVNKAPLRTSSPGAGASACGLRRPAAFGRLALNFMISTVIFMQERAYRAVFGGRKFSKKK